MATTTWEYGTYAPKGSTCNRCKREVGPLERVRRGYEAGRDPGVLANVVYTHTGNQCTPDEPAGQKAAKK
ncbi:hypothetical protein ABZ621_19515 [Streptomyces sp. NPDC007863]|uniref:hypothetical protein n=1 Tax=Streptomyces sp. NPDC007863 TaxID=3154894 RepID=UPI0033E1BB0C